MTNPLTPEELKRAKEMLPRVYELMAMRHYGLESGCDAWVELRELLEDLPDFLEKALARIEELTVEIQGQGYDLANLRDDYAYLKANLAKAERALESAHEALMDAECPGGDSCYYSAPVGNPSRTFVQCPVHRELNTVSQTLAEIRAAKSSFG